MFPFTNMTFDEMVLQYLPDARKIYENGSVDEWKRFPLFFMFIRGHYTDIYELDNLFGDKFVLIDGEMFKQRPWIALAQIERKLNLNPFFSEVRNSNQQNE